MSSRKFKFISPGVFLNEIDNSQLPNEPREVGPMVIGRAQRGPAMRPVTVDSFAEFVQLYGNPVPGGNSEDIWRNGNESTPMYGTYASQAWLKNSSTLTYLRLLGSKHIDATTAGNAGWKLSGTVTSTDSFSAAPAFTMGTAATGSAYGLFVMPNKLSGSYTTAASATGSLVAIWYIEQGAIGLVGTDLSGGSTVATEAGRGMGRLVGSSADDVFTVSITGSSENYADRVISFSLSETSDNYIRKVFNTNPTLINTDTTVAGDRERYWLGETFTNQFEQLETNAEVTGSGGAVSGGPTGTYVGVILPLVSGSNQHGSREIAFESGTTRNNPATGWVFGQDLGGGDAKATYAYDKMPKLFKFHGLDHGEWAQNNIKISIANVNFSRDQFNKYGRFDVLVRRSNDNDAAPVVLERFSNCNLDQTSPNYIASKIGDQYVQFNSTTRRLETRGDFTNNSKYIRVEMFSENPVNEELLPFGFYGPTKYKDITISPTTNMQTVFKGGAWALGASQILGTSAKAPAATGFGLIITGSSVGTGSTDAPSIKLMFPKHQLRVSASQDGLSDPTDAYWGVWTGKSNSSNKFNLDYYDLNRNKADELSSQIDEVTDVTEHQFVFSLDEVAITSGTYHWQSGSRPAGTAISSADGAATYKSVLSGGIDKFTMSLAGGSDGLKITERDPFRNASVLEGKTETTSYAFNSIKEAVDIVRDPEFVQYNLVSIPGITNEQLTTHLIETCEARADALAIIDLKGDFAPAHEGTSKTYPNLSDTITNLKNRALNSSYGCAFYPFVQARDTLAGNIVYIPPSVPAIGAMSYTDRIRAPWFAPAGFNRGGLSTGLAGLPVINVTQKLTSKDRDDLYEANINPIASFPNEGIVIFGQKTLQVTRSALDRINVRRLLIFIKKGVSNIASNILFEPNVRATWSRFIGQAEPFLADVKARFGLDDYKLVLDETTTTPDLIDRNILYAKVYLKPTRAIEFVAVDFIITNTGASFED